MDRGLRKGWISRFGISILPKGFASPVPIFATVLLAETAKLIGKPVFFFMDSATSVVH